MKVSKMLTLAVGSALLLSAAAFAGNGNRKSLHLTDKVTVQGKQLKPGNYTVEWNGTGPNVDVNIRRGNKTVATVPARIVSVSAPYKQDGYTSVAAKDGTESITQFFFSGEKFGLELSQESGANPTPGATSGTN
ncbi:MAG: hypothetical protein ACREDQ_09035 [Limisphaerales bacterium]